MPPLRKPALALVAAALLGGGPAPPLRAQRAGPPGEVPARGHSLRQLRATLEFDAARMLGKAAAAEVEAARRVVLVRRPAQFPAPPQPPVVAAAVREAAGWIRLGTGGARQAFDVAAGRELDRLLSSSDLRSARPAEAHCTDPSGIIVLARRGNQERLASFPCGLEGPIGDAAAIVLAGRIADWSKVPAAHRPPGLPLARFEERIAASYRFMSGLYEERLLAIRSRPEWQGQWRRIAARQGEAPPLPAVDFGRDMLLIAAMGPKPSGGYRVSVEKVIDQPGELLAFVRFVSPGRGCGAIAAVTSPVDIVRLPASAKPVRWVVEREANDCRRGAADAKKVAGRATGHFLFPAMAGRA